MFCVVSLQGDKLSMKGEESGGSESCVLLLVACLISLYHSLFFFEGDLLMM